MAKQVIQKLVDDLDGSEAARTVTFAIDGHSYEIDLSLPNIDKLHAVMAPFITAARPVRERGRGRRQSARAERDRTREIRQWAVDRGYQVSPRGRIPHAIVQAYEAEVGK